MYIIFELALIIFVRTSQSDGNIFCGHVILEILNMLYRDEDSILDQKYARQISRDFYHEDFKY